MTVVGNKKEQSNENVVGVGILAVFEREIDKPNSIYIISKLTNGALYVVGDVQK